MIAAGTFEEQYLSLRKKENRLYEDEQVSLLPELEPSHPHYTEWEIRNRSFRQLEEWLINKRKPLDILEIGCGNGWLCSHLAKTLKGKIIGLDINRVELEQAKRVFGAIQNLEFLYGDMEVLGNQKFDVIIFAASIQYFSSLDEILSPALQRLERDGEIHILDSHFYRESELEAARERSSAYYKEMNAFEMSHYYFHHSIAALRPYNYKILNNPGSIIHKFMKNKNPFHWICVSHA